MVTISSVLMMAWVMMAVGCVMAARLMMAAPLVANGDQTYMALF
jgi:hypothetical protein